MRQVTVVWYRDDLRPTDKPALSWSAVRGPVIGYTWTKASAAPGAAALWWMRHSLDRLLEIIPRLVQQHSTAVTWNRRYRLADVDAAIKAAVGAVSRFGFLLAEPCALRTSPGGP